MLLDRSLAMRRKALGPDHPSVAESLHRQAELLKELVRAARIVRETSCVGVGRRVVSAQVDLSLTLSVLTTQGKYAEAESLFERSQALREKVFGLEHPDVAQSLYHRAGVLENQVSLEKIPRRLVLYKRVPESFSLLVNRSFAMSCCSICSTNITSVNRLGAKVGGKILGH